MKKIFLSIFLISTFNAASSQLNTIKASIAEDDRELEEILSSINADRKGEVSNIDSNYYLFISMRVNKCGGIEYLEAIDPSSKKVPLARKKYALALIRSVTGTWQVTRLRTGEDLTESPVYS